MLESMDGASLWAPSESPTFAGEPTTLTQLRVSDVGYMSRTTDSPANKLYRARIKGDITIGQSVADRIGLGGAVGLSATAIDLDNIDRDLDPIINFGYADGRAATLKIAAITNPAASDCGTALASASTVWKGFVAGWAGRGPTARIALSDATERLNTRLQFNLFDGQGGLGGAAQQKGLPKPIFVGRGFNWTPTYIGEVDFGDGLLPTFMSHYRQIAGHDAVRERGTTRTKVSGTPTTGQWRDWPQFGCFQLGFSPGGPITCDLRGDAPDDLGYVDTHVGCITRLLTVLGPTLATSDFDTAAMALAEFDLPGTIGWGIGAQDITAMDAVSQILASGCAWLTGSRSGGIRVAALKSPDSTAAFALDVPTILEFEELPVPAELQPAPALIQIIGARNFTPLTDIASGVVGTDRDRLANPGTPALAYSSTIQARVNQTRPWLLPGLYYDTTYAETRAAVLRTFVERGLRMFRVVTDRYLGAMEIGYSGTLTYPDEELSGWSGIVVGWREQLKTRRLEVTMIG